MKLRSIATALLALAAFALATSVGCKPAVRGRCNTTRDCRQNSYCAVSGICLASSGTCAPACGEGEICSGSVCALLMPVVSVLVPPGPISPAFPQITVHVEAAVGIALHGIALEVDNSLRALASGALGAPSAGDNLVTLSKFEPNAVGGVTVRATLRFQLPGAAAEESISSVAVPAFIDAVPPTVTVFVPAAADGSSVNGWVSRIGLPLDVRATVDDGAGSGAQSATLSFDTCPATVECVYTGTAISQSGGATVFSFTVPRTAQSAGSEAPLAVTVKAQDVAGNKAQGAGTVQIDDAPPQIGATVLVSTAGVVGEDGNIWFIGGAGARDVEISVPVADSGVGLSSLTLHLTDVAGPDPTPLPQADGTVHFMLPASRVVGREGALHFTLTAADLVKNSVTTPPGNIWVDASAPAFTLPHVDYTSALPASACAAEVANIFNCGRRSPATHALRDDTVTVTFDAIDCGSGLANAASPFSVVVTSGGQSKLVSVQQAGKDNGNCANGSTNRIHHFSVQLALGDAATAVGPSTADGTVQVQLASGGADRVNNLAQSTAGTVSPDGIVLLSLWRWKIKLNAIAAGSPALLPGTAGSRTVVVGTVATPGPNLFAINPDGTQPWSATLPSGIVGDVAAGPSGAVYASTGASCGAAATCTAVNAVSPPTGPTGTAVPCSAGNASFGASPAVVSVGGGDLLYAIAITRGAGASNLFVFSPGATCTQQGSGTVVMPIADDVTGITAGAGAAFVSNGHGFTSLDEIGTGFGAQVMYNAGNTSLVTRAPPSVSSASVAGGAIFDTAGGDQQIRRTIRQPGGCGLTGVNACWIAAPGFPPPQPPTPSNLPFTPVFDGQTLWAIDDQGVVFTWAQQGGMAGPFLNLGEIASPPVLVQGGAALEVTLSGLVKLLTVSGPSMTSQRLLALQSAFSGKVPAPVIDCRNATCSGSAVAYVPAADNWVWAVQLPAAPVAASTSAWPRPGHDSCNTRNATADASKCP